MWEASGCVPSCPNMPSNTPLERVEPDDGVGVLRQQQVFHHVEDEQRAHPVIGKALPHLGGEQERQAARMAEQVARRGIADLGIGDGHRGLMP